MLSTRAPRLRYYNRSAKNKARFCKSSSASSLQKERSEVAATEAVKRSEKAKDIPSSDSSTGSLDSFEEKSDKTNTFVSTPVSLVGNEPSPATEKVKSPAPELASPVVELLFPSQEVRKTEVLVNTPKKLALPKRPQPNPFRTDVRMGVRGNVGVGAVTHQQQKPTLSKRPRTEDEAEIQTAANHLKLTPLESKPANEEERKEARKKQKVTAELKAATAATAAKCQVSVVDAIPRLPGITTKLAAADRSVGRVLKDVRGKPEWRKDNPDLDEVDELLRNARGKYKGSPSKKAGMATGTKKLLKAVGGGGSSAGRFINPATVQKRTREY